jgi:two-component system LytT family response regulator
MAKVKCIIIEDEKPAQEVVKSFVSRIEWIDLRAVFGDAIAALDYLNSNEVDLIFLDVHIPSLNGMDFLKVGKNLPQVIITTAYSQYALDAFDLNVRDYLVKPFSFERFLKAVNRVSLAQQSKSYGQSEKSQTSTTGGYAFFNVNKTMIRVMFDDVLYVESMREYISIHTKSGRIITKMGIGEIEDILGNGFLRIHRSFLVNQMKVTAYNAEEVLIDTIRLPIGPNYKKIIEAAFSKMIVRT